MNRWNWDHVSRESKVHREKAALHGTIIKPDRLTVMGPGVPCRWLTSCCIRGRVYCRLINRRCTTGTTRFVMLRFVDHSAASAPVGLQTTTGLITDPHSAAAAEHPRGSHRGGQSNHIGMARVVRRVQTGVVGSVAGIGGRGSAGADDVARVVSALIAAAAARRLGWGCSGGWDVRHIWTRPEFGWIDFGGWGRGVRVDRLRSSTYEQGKTKC